MTQKYLINTIDQTHQRSQDEGIGVSKNFIRQSVLDGSLPHVRAGKKYLINWDHFMEFLNTPTQVQRTEPPAYGIVRPVPEKLRR